MTRAEPNKAPGGTVPDGPVPDGAGQRFVFACSLKDVPEDGALGVDVEGTPVAVVQAEGEVYALAYHVIPDRAGGWIEDLRLVRYLDWYRKEYGTWRFSKRLVTYDHTTQRPAQVTDRATADGEKDASYGMLRSRLFARGERE